MSKTIQIQVFGLDFRDSVSRIKLFQITSNIADKRTPPKYLQTYRSPWFLVDPESGMDYKIFFSIRNPDPIYLFSERGSGIWGVL